MRLVSRGASLLSVDRILIRNFAAGALLDRFLVSAVAAVLGIRVFLALTGYPKVGGAGLHVAHMLWGGLLMLIALLLMLAYLGQRVARLAAVLGGLGFGTFIDELGKFITSDNNYFFRPTIALIYIIFALLFVVVRALERQRPWSQETYLSNVLLLLHEAVLHELDDHEKAQAVALLRRCDQDNAVARTLRELLEGTAVLRASRPSRRMVLAHQLRRRYRCLISSLWFQRAFIVAFLTGAALGLAVLALGGIRSLGGGHLTVSQWGTLVAAVAAATLILVGLASLRRSRLAAFKWFKRSVLLSIFLIDVFAFYEQELAAIGHFTIDLLALVLLNSLIRHELWLSRHRHREQMAALTLSGSEAGSTG